MILKLSLNTQIICKVFVKILNNIPGKEGKILIVSDDMIPDVIINKKLNPMVTELFFRGRKINILLAFITQSYFKVPKEVRLNCTHCFIMKSPRRRFIKNKMQNHILFR